VICHFTLNAVVSVNPHRAMSWALVANKVCVCDSTVENHFEEDFLLCLQIGT
jgi:hypothetical protein